MGFQTNMIWMLLAAICVVAFIELAADYFLKRWSSNHRHWWYLVAGMAVYALVGCSYGVSLLMGDLPSPTVSGRSSPSCRLLFWGCLSSTRSRLSASGVGSG